MTDPQEAREMPQKNQLGSQGFEGLGTLFLKCVFSLIGDVLPIV